MSDAVGPLQQEIAKRKQRLAVIENERTRLTVEIDSLASALAVVAPSAPEPSEPVAEKTPGVVALQALGAVVEGVLSVKWKAQAEAVLSDYRGHALGELVEVAHAREGMGAPIESVRKSLHMWITRRVEKGEVKKLERGWYQLVRKAEVA